MSIPVIQVKCLSRRLRIFSALRRTSQPSRGVGAAKSTLMISISSAAKLGSRFNNPHYRHRMSTAPNAFRYFVLIRLSRTLSGGFVRSPPCLGAKSSRLLRGAPGSRQSGARVTFFAIALVVTVAAGTERVFAEHGFSAGSRDLGQSRTRGCPNERSFVLPVISSSL